LETSVEVAIPCTPNAEFAFKLLAINTSKSLQLADLGVAILDIDAQ
jgi:hypothetical protein